MFGENKEIMSLLEDIEGFKDEVLEFISNDLNLERHGKSILKVVTYGMCIVGCLNLKIRLGINIKEELNILDNRVKSLQFSDKALEDLMRVDYLSRQIIGNNKKVDMVYPSIDQVEPLCSEIVYFFMEISVMNHERKLH